MEIRFNKFLNKGHCAKKSLCSNEKIIYSLIRSGAALITLELNHNYNRFLVMSLKFLIHKYFTEFRCGRISTSDAERPGRPKEVTSQEMIDKIHIVLNDLRLKVREIS